MPDAPMPDAPRIDVFVPVDAGLRDAGSCAPAGLAMPRAESTWTVSGGNALFPIRVASSGDGEFALLGLVHGEVAGAVSGRAIVLRRTLDAGRPRWVEEATLFAASSEAPGGFGGSVALSADGTRAIVGAPGGPRGRAHVFVRSALGATVEWREEATLVGGSVDDHFGWSVALSADATWALVGAEWDDVPGVDSAGLARVYLRSGSTWTEQASLMAADAAPADRLGASVSLDADASRALVGAPGTDRSAGSSHVFVRSGTGWAAEATLISSRRSDWARFGSAVALSADGTRALVGDDTIGIGAGDGAFVFVRTGTTWTEEASLPVSCPTAPSWFGTSVALDAAGDRALVGAPRDDTAAGEEAGRARLYVRTEAGGASTWTEDAWLGTPPGGTDTWLGYSVALSADGGRALAAGFVNGWSDAITEGNVRSYVLGP